MDDRFRATVGGRGQRLGRGSSLKGKWKSETNVVVFADLGGLKRLPFAATWAIAVGRAASGNVLVVVEGAEKTTGDPKSGRL